VDYDSWYKEYKAICKELDILPKDDYDARDLAAQIIGDSKQYTTKLEQLIRDRNVVVFGAGPSLEEGVKNLDKEGTSFTSGEAVHRFASRTSCKTLITADGATSCLLENGIYPDIVVTDLDGDIKDLLLADRFGAIMVVHAHGDNQDKIKKYLPEIKTPVVTTQVEPLKNVHNYFGFTDGDRAVSMAQYFKAKNIELIGFDFGDIVGKYSDPANATDHKAEEKKKRKLGIAQRLIEKIKKENS
jgi:uncharacterized Rossmann fold enzyme